MIQVVEDAAGQVSEKDTNGTETKSAKQLLTIKGAPDILLPRCSRYLETADTVGQLGQEQLKLIENTKDKWSREAKRVILLAQKEVPEKAPSDTQSREYEDFIMNEAGRRSDYRGPCGADGSTAG